MNELLVMLKIGGRSAAIPAVDVKSVIEVDEIYPVPRAPNHVVGLTAMRSRSLTVIDSRIAIGIDQVCKAGERAAVIEIDGHQYALLVDSVEDVAESQSELTPVAGGFGKAWEQVARGMVETETGPTLLLDIANLITEPDRAAA